MDRLISLEPSNLVVIRIEPGHKCFGEVTLRNVMHTMPVAFRFQPLNKACYVIRPQSGIIPPLSTVSLEITYILPPNSTLPESFPYSDDSFILHSVVVPGAVFKESSSTFDTVPDDWFSIKKKQVFIDSAVGVIFVGSVVLAQLITKGLMKEVREVLKVSNSAWHAADSFDDQGQTPLHLAIAQSRTDLVELLLDYKPDVEGRNQAGESPLEAAVANGELLIVEKLLACHASTGRSESSKWGPIHLAVRGGHLEILKLLMLEGAEVDILTGDGRTALHLAVQENQNDCARVLLDNGARPDLGSASNGETALHLAASLGHEDMVKLLLKKGSNNDILDRLGRTAYDVATQCGHKQLYDVLRLGDSLCGAARKGEARTIHWLLQNGALIQGVDQHGWTALHRAAFKGQVNTVRTLIDQGVDIDTKDKDGYTALHCATESGQAEVIEVLVKKGAKVELQTNKGVTASQIANSFHYPGISRILSQAGIITKETIVHVSVPKSSAFSNANSVQDPATDNIKKKPSRRRVHRRSFDQLIPVAVI